MTPSNNSMEHPTFSHGHYRVFSEVAAPHTAPMYRFTTSAHCKPMSLCPLLEIFGSIFGDNKSRHTQVNKTYHSEPNYRQH